VGLTGFNGVGLGHLGIDLSVWKYGVDGSGNAVHAFCIYRRWLIRAQRWRVHFARMRGNHFGLKNYRLKAVG
jgi:hypothetical protein